MKITIECDESEARLMLKARDMACLIFDLVHNSFQDNPEARDRVNELLEEYSIDIGDLIQ